jgi:hypothetical protein
MEISACSQHARAHIRGLIRVEVRAFCDCQPGHAGRRCFLVFPDSPLARYQRVSARSKFLRIASVSGMALSNTRT